ncbi:MAG TPA: DNA N-6-adenine-methyltransferase, partial [Spirochaetia bacterium]|nr:DNA N-6-adenine-methyltransferase [Spirochaetia bacterium]
YIIEAVRAAMESIDLDPASCPDAQKTVKSAHYFTEQDNGLEQDWYGNVFLNPPYKMPLIELFIEKLIEELPNLNSAILLTNNNTDTKWFLRAVEKAQGVCFTKGRIHFYTAERSETQPTNGQALFYFGQDFKSFKEIFSGIGWIAKYDS